jgi:ABC-2 type transport system permease protein
MIATVLRIFWIHLRRDRVVWLLTFIVPVAFFSIFAIIFSGQGRSSTPTVRVAVVDEDASDFSKRLVVILEEDKSLQV